MKLSWSRAALADLNRFAAFLQDHHPALARRIGVEILKRAEVLSEYPEFGRPIRDRGFASWSFRSWVGPTFFVMPTAPTASSSCASSTAASSVTPRPSKYEEP
ncbi:type II toxin-antitoxin system RelE/ParE family toxin [Rhodopseudomonas palustris]|uniref:type II toxin-antitoxin system RelE/ParE family toxin n=1 Tax=Rhodopseudomonas palustris TaxID=1076 RepID=UPI0009A4C7F3|nr:hypothetical protein B1S06_18455 [Rhodopseudomonas palustris]PPQ40939.1 type II toxin-antitoxin system RelE/ParE family toxin [Rhodopseudomonas palustris]RJF60396.1 type II toxin-antitoxin system RelE/ParE family toxin [Rhodopseudomonas palustris]